MLITLCGILEFSSYGGVIGSRPEVLLSSAIIYSVMMTDVSSAVSFCYLLEKLPILCKNFSETFPGGDR